MAKEWYKSKTLWVNILTLLAMILSAVMQWPELQSIAPQIAVALSIVNIALRLITDSKLV